MDLVRNVIPWYIKILAKLILSRIPLGYKIWRVFHIFRHGRMDDIQYARAVCQRHFSELGQGKINWRGLELGPGDGLYSGLYAKVFGASQFVMIDDGNYANLNLDNYTQLLKNLASVSSNNTNNNNPPRLVDILKSLDVHYYTNGLESIKNLPDSYYEFLFSNAVLEHVRRGDFQTLVKEMWRILKPGGIASHVIDFRDHLSGGLNNLRFSRKIWESNWFAAGSGFYTNRYGFSELIDIFSRVGFVTEIRYQRKWPLAPIAFSKVHSDLGNMLESDLLVSGAHFVLHKPASTQENRSIMTSETN